MDKSNSTETNSTAATKCGRTFGVALFGVGRIGAVHLGNLFTNQRAKLRWVVEEDLVRAAAMLDRYGLKDYVDIAPVSQADRVLKDEQVDAVMICTPSFTHEELITKALKAGKAVFCEKPLAPTVEATEACFDLAEKVGKPLFCAFNRHWDPQTRKLRTLAQGGDVGRLRVVKSVSRDPPGMATANYIKTSGGIFIDSAVHDMDLLCWIVGERPVSVFATGHATLPLYKECGDVDTCHIVLKFPCGVIGSVEISREAPLGYFQYMEAFGTKGMVHTDQRRDLELKHWNMDGMKVEPLTDFLGRYMESYRDEIDHFMDVLEGKCSVELTREAVIGVNRLAVSCKESLDKGILIKL